MKSRKQLPPSARKPISRQFAILTPEIREVVLKHYGIDACDPLWPRKLLIRLANELVDRRGRPRKRSISSKPSGNLGRPVRWSPDFNEFLFRMRREGEEILNKSGYSKKITNVGAIKAWLGIPIDDCAEDRDQKGKNLHGVAVDFARRLSDAKKKASRKSPNN